MSADFESKRSGRSKKKALGLADKLLQQTSLHKRENFILFPFLSAHEDRLRVDLDLDYI